VLRLCVVSLFAVVGCAPSAHKRDEVAIAAAASLKPILHELELSSNITYGATGSLIAQASRGADFEILLVADERSARQLVEQRLATDADCFTFAMGRLALCVRTPEPFEGFAILQSPTIRTIAVPNPRLAPYGFAAKTALLRSNLEAALEAKFVFPENVEQAANMLNSRAVDAAFVASSVPIPITQRWLVPAELHEPLTQIGVIVKRSTRSEAVRAKLLTAKAREHFVRHGYAVPTESQSR
jgi:molybdate transport system substrate-binding protein